MAATEQQTEAKDALFAAIANTAKESKDYTGSTQAQMVRDAAFAWRALVGGQQPGGIYVDAK